MKTIALIVTLLAAAGSALAGHSIGIYADQAALNCEITDAGGGIITFYVVHTNEVYGTIGSAWTLTWDPGMTMTWVGDDATPFSIVGNAKDGASIFYSVCQGGTFKIDSVSMLSYGTSAPCSYFRLAPHPSQGLVFIDCGFRYLPLVPGEAIVNANGSCACTVSAEPATWGTIKALYR